jgi:GNAT superfamily N-acetyltransferase
MLDDRLLIRDAELSNVNAIAALITELGYPTATEEMQIRLTSVAQHPDYKTLVAETDNEIVGLAGMVKGMYYEHNGTYVRILAFVVKKNFRNRSVGKQLLKACEDWAIAQGAKTMLLNSGNRNERVPAHLFYQKMGYQVKSSGFVKML